MDLSPFLSFLLATVIGLGISGVTFYVARKSGLGKVQESLISTLQDNAKALAERVDILESEVKKLAKVRSDLETEVRRLRRAVTDLVLENSEFRERLKLPPREEPIIHDV